MKRSIAVLSVALAIIGGIMGWPMLLRKYGASRTPPSTKTATLLATTDSRHDVDAALHTLLTATAGQITGRSVQHLRAILTNGSRESSATLERALLSESPAERLIAVRFLLETEGWSQRMRERAIEDRFVLLRVEAASWLYLSSRFKERAEFFEAISVNGAIDYHDLASSFQHLRWAGLPASLEMLEMGRGIDRFLIDLLRTSEAAANAAATDLGSGLFSPTAQEPLLHLLHAANRADYEPFLKTLLARATEDTPARYAGIWLLGQGFASTENRNLLKAHLANQSVDPLLPRIRQSLLSIERELTLGRSRLDVFETRFAEAFASGAATSWGPAFLVLMNEALRQQRVLNPTNLEAAKQALASATADYNARERLADIEFLLSKT